MEGDCDRDWSIFSFESSDTLIASPGSNAVVGRVRGICDSSLGRGRLLTVDIRGGLVDRGRGDQAEQRPTQAGSRLIAPQASAIGDLGSTKNGLPEYLSATIS